MTCSPALAEYALTPKEEIPKCSRTGWMSKAAELLTSAMSSRCPTE
jgi:hypothetical protein